MPDKLEGRTLGDFRLEKLIGRGSAGRVYRAVQVSLNRPVAVKVLEEGLFTLEDLTKRFLREAEIVARLEHPHIVPVYSAGRDGNFHFFAMRLVEGPSLAERIERGLELAEGLRYVAQLADALSYAHARGLVHRDVKPANILVCDGSAVLTDFGLARLLEGTTITASSVFLGTPRYTSPEQARQERATSKSDLYALGVILYEIAVGRHPFQALQSPAPPREELIGRIATGLFDPPREVRPDLPPEVEEVILRAMHPLPEERFGSGAEMRRAIERVLLKTADVRAPSDLARGKAFGKFVLVEEIGQGGMGVVYRAEQTDLRRTVALKVLLHEDGADGTTVARFHREAQAAARLRHANIVPIHEIGEVNGRSYFTMDLVDGEDLEAWMAREKPGPRRTFEVVRDAARAVAYAHEQGVIHRDLKPGNILVERGTGRVLVMDFGLAKDLRGGNSKLTASGEVMGTPAYMAPEQTKGRSTPATDVYALGAVLYHLLTGGPPHTGATPVDVMLSVLNRDPIPPRTVRPGLPADAETICLKALEKDEARRYPSAAEFAGDCDRFLAGEPIAARPLSTVGRMWRKASRHRRLLIPIAIAALLAAAAIGWAVLSARQKADAERQLERLREEKK